MASRRSNAEPRLSSRAILVLLPVALAVLIAACGGSGSDESDTAGDTSVAQDASATTEEPEGVESTDAAPTTAPATTATTPTTEAEPFVDPVRFADDFGTSIQPIFAERCGACHGPGGPGTQHWELTTAKALADDAKTISLVVESGYMPPWPAGGDSPAFHEDRSLRQDQVDAILAWHAAGAPLDVPGETVIEPTTEVVGLANPDLTLTPADPYAGSTALTDDYRCQIYDPELPDGGWITGYEFIPDQTEVVHHAIGYLIPADARDRAEARDGEDGKPGWQCFGSSGVGEDDIFLGWAPGQLPSVMPEGTGLWVEPGAFIVVQIHYHYETSAPADLSALAIDLETGVDLDPITVSEFIAPAEIPCSSDEEGPLCDRDAAIAAAVERYGNEGVQADGFLRVCGYTVDDFATMTDGVAWSSCDIPVLFVGAVGEIISVLGHEHEIGDWFKMTLNPDTDEERVLLDIPDWNFDWQYNYAPKDRIVLDADDTIRIECGWDRSRRDPKLEPAYVLWADGTNDEMCFATITTRPAR